MIRFATLLILFGIALGGCTTRQRTNPLDPRNSQTQGGLVGFNALAGDSVVELRWPPLLVDGVLGYRVQRWRPGEAPRLLGAADLNPAAIASEDFDVANDSTYVYRLVAHFDTGDSAVSPPDTATPGPRRIFALTAETPSLVRLTPDARDLLYEEVVGEAYVDFELDRSHDVLWFAAETAGDVVRRTFNGAIAGTLIPVATPGDLSVSSNRGLGWVVSVGSGSVNSYGPDLNDATLRSTIRDVADPRVVEAGTSDPSVWVGSEEGEVDRFRAQDLTRTHVWNLGPAAIRAIALDETRGGAWVATRALSGSLYYLDPTDSSATLVRSPLLSAADLAVDPPTGDLWLAERGPSNLGAGRLSLITPAGVALATVGAIEPYGLDVDPLDGSCWVTDLHSNRLLHVDRSGAILRASPPLATPYAVRVAAP